MREPKIGGVGEIIRKVLAAALHSEEEIVSWLPRLKCQVGSSPAIKAYLVYHSRR